MKTQTILLLSAVTIFTSSCSKNNIVLEKQQPISSQNTKEAGKEQNLIRSIKVMQGAQEIENIIFTYSDKNQLEKISYEINKSESKTNREIIFSHQQNHVLITEKMNSKTMKTFEYNLNENQLADKVISTNVQFEQKETYLIEYNNKNQLTTIQNLPNQITYFWENDNPVKRKNGTNPSEFWFVPSSDLNNQNIDINALILDTFPDFLDLKYPLLASHLGARGKNLAKEIEHKTALVYKFEYAFKNDKLIKITKTKTDKTKNNKQTITHYMISY